MMVRPVEGRVDRYCKAYPNYFSFRPSASSSATILPSDAVTNSPSGNVIVLPARK